MKRFWICLLALLLLLLAPAAALAAKVVSPGEDFYYLDQAGVLDRDTEGEIYFCNKLLEEKCGAQIVVVALEDIGGADILDYAAELGDSWGIGSAEENNGFLLLMTIEDENYYAIAGRGLQRIFPASTIKALYDKYLEADFAAGRYDAGAKKFFEAVFERVADLYNLTITPADGIAAYQSFEKTNAGARDFGGAQSSGARGGYDDYDGHYGGHYDGVYADTEDEGMSFFGLVVSLILLLIVLRVLSRIMVGFGSTFWLWHLPIFFGPIRGPRHYYRPYEGPGPHGPRRRPPRGGGFGGGGFGGFGGGHGGGGGFGGGGFGSFGGGHGGGGGGFGGGAGRGRH